MWKNVDPTPDNLYVNLSLNNQTPDSTGRATLSKVFTENILDNPSDYYCAVVKLEVPLQALPLMIFPDPAVPGFDWRIGVVEYDKTTTVASPWIQTIPFISENGFNSIGSANYYWVYHYGQVSQMINAALSASYIAAGSPGGDPVGPYVTFDNGIFSFVLPQSFVNAPSAGTGWSIAWNNNFNIYFPTWNVYLKNINNQPDLAEYTLITDQLSYDKSFISGTDYLVPQEFSSVDYLNSLRKIVVVSNNLPARKEYIPASLAANNQSTNSNADSVLIDLQVQLERETGQQRGILTYEADLYRLVDLISNSPLQRINIELYWVDSLNNTYPVPVTRSDSVNIKLGFFKKSLFKN